VASGSGAGMPQKAIVERGYKGKIYQTHAAATQDLMRIAGKDAEGTFVVSGPATVAEQLPDSHPVEEGRRGLRAGLREGLRPGSRNQFAGHARRAHVLEKAVPSR
jgi:branched-chain amino acid transport system substrate-binding protein